jgi:prophage regulatory protein
MVNQYLTDKQLAARFSVGRTTIWRWVREKNFPSPVRLGEAVTRWKLIDVELWEKMRRGQN